MLDSCNNWQVTMQQPLQRHELAHVMHQTDIGLNMLHIDACLHQSRSHPAAHVVKPTPPYSPAMPSRFITCVQLLQPWASSAHRTASLHWQHVRHNMMKSTCARLQVHANCLQDVGLMPCTSNVKLKITALSLKIDSTLQSQHIICASKHLTKIVEQCNCGPG